MKLMLVTADEAEIIEAQAAGIDRIFLDLEYINKVERQMGRNTLISNNSLADVPRVSSLVDKSQCELLVRVNPINPNSQYEIDSVIENGADIVMLPMVLDSSDVKKFVKYVNGRAKVCPLLETSQALARIDDILAVSGIDEVYVGLNDMHISMNLTFMFEFLSGGLMEYMADKFKKAKLSFGFGGIARIGEGMLPAEEILGEHIRLGSESVILSRSFRGENGVDFKSEIKKLRDKEAEMRTYSESELEGNRLKLKASVNRIVESMSGIK